MPFRHARLPRFSRLARVAFFAAGAIALTRALWPDPLTESYVGQWDKLVHASVFYLLAALATAAWPRAALWRLAVALALFGGAIEILQAIPMLHRDASWDDWLADWVGILAALGPAVLGGLRARMR